VVFCCCGVHEVICCCKVLLKLFVTQYGTKVRRYNGHSTDSLGWNAKILIYFPNKIYGSNFTKEHSETAMV